MNNLRSHLEISQQKSVPPRQGAGLMDDVNTNEADKLITNDQESQSEHQQYNTNEVNKENFYGHPDNNHVSKRSNCFFISLCFYF